MAFVLISLTTCAFGILSNTCMAFLLIRPKLSSTINRLLALVTLSDALLMLSYFVYVLHFEWDGDDICPLQLLTFNWVLFQLLYSAWSVYLRAFSLWTAVAMAAYRKRVLSQNVPRRPENIQYALKIAATIGLCLLVICTPIFLQNTVAMRSGGPMNDTVCPQNHGRIYYALRPPYYALLYDQLLIKIAYWVNGIILKLCPCVFLAYYLIHIVYLMYRQQNRRQQTLFNDRRRCDNCRSKMRPTTVILTCILLTTVLCEMPNAVLSVMSGLFPDIFIWQLYVRLGEIMNLLSLFNCTSCTILYFVMSRSLRKAFVEIICECGWREESVNNPSSLRSNMEQRDYEHNGRNAKTTSV